MMQLKHSASRRAPSSKGARNNWRAVLAFIWAAASVSGTAFAHERVYTVDSLQVLSKTALGQDMALKLEQLEVQQVALLRPVQEALQAEKDALEAQIAILNPEQIRNNSKFQGQIQSFQQRTADFDLRQRRVVQELQLTKDTAVRSFNKAMIPVVEAIAQSLGSKLIVEKRTALFVSDSIDVTDRVIESLDREKKSMDVNWQTINPPKAQAQTKK